MYSKLQRSVEIPQDEIQCTKKWQKSSNKRQAEWELLQMREDIEECMDGKKKTSRTRTTLAQNFRAAGGSVAIMSAEQLCEKTLATR